MADINSKNQPKAGCQVLYNSHDKPLVALSQRPPQISYISLGCGQMTADFSPVSHPQWEEFLNR